MPKGNTGFTFIELLICIAIIIPVLLGVFGVDIYLSRASDTSRQVMAALQDANTVIERIRNVASNQGLTQVTATYPSGQAVAGFTGLTNEQAVVTYPNAVADPLAITVTVTWQDAAGRNLTRALSTQVTRR